MFAELTSREEEGAHFDALVWRLPRTMLCASTAVFGGGLGPRQWVFNAEVANDYHRVDIEAHVGELRSAFNLDGAGVGMLTAARVARHEQANEGGVDAQATVGVSHPTWAASDEAGVASRAPGTINMVVFVPVRLDDGALLNALTTATEAKSQALWDAGVAATGTPSDAVTVLCPLDGDHERFGGPRSLWGARLARVVHDAVFAGAKAAVR